jgi:hypothetical protein
MKWTIRWPGSHLLLTFDEEQVAFNYMVRNRPRGAKLFAPDGTVLLSVGEAQADA